MSDINTTKKLAEDLAQKLPARVYALVGELGAGKTTFTQFFLRALGVTEPITSPTFVIMKSYSLKSKPYSFVRHIDCYRLDKAQDLDVLDFEAVIADTNSIVIIEWADKIKDRIPHDALWLYFKHGVQQGEREIIIA